MFLAKCVSHVLPYPRVKYHPYIPRGLLLYKIGLLLSSTHKKRVDLSHLLYYQFSNFLHVRIHKVQLQHLLLSGCINDEISKHFLIKECYILWMKFYVLSIKLYKSIFRIWQVFCSASKQNTLVQYNYSIIENSPYIL
jgi:hypothetical protein